MHPATRRSVLSALATAGVLGTSACLGRSDTAGQNETANDTEPMPIEEPDGALEPNRGVPFQIFNFAPDAGALDLFFADTYHLTIDFGDDPHTGELFLGDDGSTEAAIAPADSPPDQAHATAPIESAPQTLVALGEVCGLSDTPIDLKAYTDDLSPTPAGHARVRAVHAAPDVPRVDVGAPDGPLFYEDLGFGESAEAHLPVEAEVAAVMEAGTDNVLAKFPIDPKEGYHHTAIGIGYLDPRSAPSAVPEDFGFSLAVAEDDEIGVEE